MTTRVMIAILALAATQGVVAGQQGTGAEQVVEEYLAFPYPQYEQSRAERLEVLKRFAPVANQAAAAIEKALPQVTDPRQRAELAEALGNYVQTPEAALLLVKLLDDPDDQVRWRAIHALRMLSRRTDRTGGTRIQREPAATSGQSRESRERAVREALQSGRSVARRRTVEPQDERSEPLVEFAPKVEGLVPFLVKAAGDEVEANRLCALYALADSRDPAGVAELRNRLEDPSEQVRFYAACFLTEYQDTSGLDILLEALDRLQAEDLQANHEREFEYFGDVERLVASFERITGKSFGAIPMNPTLSSSTVDIPVLAERHMALLATWSQWWAWQPPAGS